MVAMVHAGCRSRCMLLLLALLVSAGCLGAAAAAAAAHDPPTRPQHQPPPTIGWAVQLSDIHISTNKAPDIQSDLTAFGALLGALQPAALLVGGDLVDAKLPGAVGTHQYPQEWQAYQQLWHQLAAAAGLPPSAVLDLRGNHDVFDTWRDAPPAAAAAAGGGGLVGAGDTPKWQRKQGYLSSATTTTSSSGSGSKGEQGSLSRRQPGAAKSMLDPFATWSAAAEVGGAQAAARRVTTHYLWPQLLLGAGPSPSRPEPSAEARGVKQQKEEQRTEDGSRESAAAAAAAAARGARRAGRALTVKRGAWQQLFKQLPGADLNTEEQSRAALQAQVCPAAALVGFDVTPRLGLHGLGDFFGVVTQQLVSDLETALQQVRTPDTITAAAVGGTRGKLHIVPPGSSTPTGQQPTGTAAAAAEGACGASIPIVSYSHQPTSMNYISTSPVHTGVTPAAAADAAAAASHKLHPGGSGRRPKQPTSLRCSSRWCGGAAAVIRSLLQQWDVSWVMVGHLHTVPGDRMHRVMPKAPAAPGEQAGTYLAELEVGDWKDSRRWRLVVADAGTLTFADFTFINHPQQQQQQQQHGKRDLQQQQDKSSVQGAHRLHSRSRQLLHAAVPVPTIAAALRQQGMSTGVPVQAAAARDAWVVTQPYSLTGVDPTRVVADRVVLLTWPPDARYSPLSQTGLRRWQQESWQARILVLPVYPSSSTSGVLSADNRRVKSAVLAWHCVTHWGSSQVHGSGSVQLQQQEVQWLQHKSPVTTGQQQQLFNSSSGSEKQGEHTTAAAAAVAAGQASVLSADLAADSNLVACQASGRLLLLQALVTTVDDGATADGQALVSSSELRPVILHPVTPTAPVKQVKQAGGSPLLPLQLTTLERIALAWDWPLVLHVVFHVAWAGNLLLLIGPWLLCKYGPQVQQGLGRLQPTSIPAAASSTTAGTSSTATAATAAATAAAAAAAAAAVGASWPRWSYTPAQGYQPVPPYGTNNAWSSSATSSSPAGFTRGQQGSHLGVTTWFTAAMASACLGLWRYVLQPPMAWLLVLVHHRPLWWSYLGYSAWLLLGPWVVVVKLTSYTRGPALLTSYGYVAKIPVPVDGRAGQVYYGDTMTGAGAGGAGQDLWQWQYQLLPCPDLQIDLLPFIVLGVVPFTLCMAWVLATWSRLSCSHPTAAMSSTRSPPNGTPAAAGVAATRPTLSLPCCATVTGQALLLLPVLAAWYRTCKRVWGHYGSVTLVLSPVLVWGPGLLLVLLIKQLLRGGGGSAAAMPRCPSCASLTGESRAGACKERSE